MFLMIVRLPIVEVISPDRERSFWVAAVAPEQAMETVAQALPEGHVSKLLKHRLRVKSDALRPGQVRLA
jgi:hypothetical protein